MDYDVSVSKIALQELLIIRKEIIKLILKRMEKFSPPEMATRWKQTSDINISPVFFLIV